MTDGCSEQTKSKKNAFTIGKLYGGLVFPALKHFILTSAPTLNVVVQFLDMILNVLLIELTTTLMYVMWRPNSLSRIEQTYHVSSIKSRWWRSSGEHDGISKRYDDHVNRFHATEAVKKLPARALTYKVIVIDFETNQWNASALNGINHDDISLDVGSYSHQWGKDCYAGSSFMLHSYEN